MFNHYVMLQYIIMNKIFNNISTYSIAVFFRIFSVTNSLARVFLIVMKIQQIIVPEERLIYFAGSSA
jgi:hypothetical protein